MTTLKEAIDPTTRPAQTVPNVFRDIIVIYVKASAFAVASFIVLMLTDGSYSVWQVAAFMIAIGTLVPVYVAVDVLVIRGQIAPLRKYFDGVAAGRRDPKAAVEAIICLLNLPWRTVVRILTVHGPGAGMAGGVTIIICNTLLDLNFSTTQSMFLLGFILIFATPAHALFEYFAITRYCEQLLKQIWPQVRGFPPEIAANVRRMGLKPKLISLILFISTMPIVFLSASIIMKLGEMGEFGLAGIDAKVYWSVGSISLVSLLGGLAASLLMGQEVGHHVNQMLSVMNRVERGDLKQELHIVSADEYMQLYRGFNMMIEGLRSEIELLEVTKDVSGEIQLDALLGRLMQSAAMLLDAERASVFLYDKKTDELYSRYAIGLERGDIRFPASAGIAGHVFRSGEALQVDDAYADPRFNRDVDRRTSFRTRNILCIPILTKIGEQIGVTQVINKRDGAFNNRDLQRLTAFTSQVSVVLENAKLFDEVLQVKNYNENILKSASDSIITVESDGTIIKINLAGQNLLAKDVDPVGRNIRELFAQSSDWLFAAVHKVIESGKPDNFTDTEIVTEDDRAVSANIKIDPLFDAEEKIIGALLSIEDLSDEKRLKSSMSRYLSKEVVDQVMSGGLDALGGKDQEVSVLFSDIRSFSSIAEALSATAIVEMLNEYFTSMVDQVFANQGVLDKFIGDAVMAIYGTPFPGPKDAENAVKSAIGMFRELDAMNHARAKAGKPPIKMGVGINSGRAVVGNIGSPKRMEYTVIGDAVNLASRIESLTKHYGAEILISKATLQRIEPKLLVREVDLITVKGKDLPETIYEVMREDGPKRILRHQGGLADFAGGIELYRSRRFADAATLFDAIAKAAPDDTPCKIYLERCSRFMAAPPPDNWDGVWRHEEK